MNRVVSTALALAAGALTLTSSLAAQQQGAVQPNRFAIDGSIGFSVPTQGQLNTGVDVMGAFEWKPGSLQLPLWFRGEIGYSNWGVSNINDSQDAWRFLADAVLPFHLPGIPFYPYALAGIGIYHQSCCGVYSSTGVGINFGGGVRYPIAGIEPYFELRYHAIFDNQSDFLPFQFGVRFKLP
jgi:hypothetical protein